MIKFLQFDSQLFGYDVGSLVLEKDKLLEPVELLNTINKSNFKLIYFRSPREFDYSHYFDILQLSEYNEIKYTFFKVSKPAFNSFSLNENEEINFLDNKVVNYNSIKLLAYQSGEFSRFKLDGKFLNNEFYKLYDFWIENIFNPLIESAIVFKCDSIICGFLSWRNSGLDIKVGLIAVDKEWRNKGIGKKLLLQLENIVQGGSNIFINTQDKNLSAIKFYSKLGYKIIETEYIHHLWK